MNRVLSITFSLLVSLCLLGAELIDSFHFIDDMVIELADSSEENPTEDCKDSELELEVYILSENLDGKNITSINAGLYIGQNRLFSVYCKDIPIPPPDLV